MLRAMLLVFIAVVMAMPVHGQRRRDRGPRSPVDHKAYNVEYFGDYTFVRIRYSEGFDGRFSRNPGWAHDYPRAERNFSRIVNEITNIQMRMDGSNILTLDDPELYRYPIAYLSEPGYWTMSPAEEEGLRSYLLKGGFMIVDDFAGRGHWSNFASQVAQVLPELRLVKLDATHPIFNAFFAIETLDDFVPPYGYEKPEFWGLFENNDPDGRLLMIANYNNDIGDYWEFSDTGWLPIDLSNEAYKLGVNYLVYAMTR
jgi:hypothetical protein